MDFNQLLPLLVDGTYGTIYMTILSTLFSYVIGIPLGIVLFVTDGKNISQNKFINLTVGTVVNLLRSIRG